MFFECRYYAQTGRNTLHIACSQGANETVVAILRSGRVKDINARTQVGMWIEKSKN